MLKSQNPVSLPGLLEYRRGQTLRTLPLITPQNAERASDLVEILSPADEPDRSYKRSLDARFGAKDYWLVDREAQSVEALTLGGHGYERWPLTGKEMLCQR